MSTVTTADDQTTQAATRVTGTVRWFSHKGFGFISRPDGDDVYVHHSGIAGHGFRSLTAGAQVRFAVRQTARGPEAVDVVTVEHR